MALSFVRPHIREMSGYTPGEQPAPGDRVIKLNTNENPFPPSDRVAQALSQIDGEMLRRYPQPMADLFRHAAARLLNVTPDMILCGNGSDDLLTIATRTFVPPGGKLAFPTPTYSLYPVLSQLEQANAVAVPWEDSWSLPTSALLATNADAIYLANPNAPSGTFISPSKVEALAKKFSGLLLVDEAYVDFADDNCVSLLKTCQNVLITRTLSKAYSLAGLRFGYAIANPAVIAEMTKVKDSYNCDVISTVLATAAIGDQEYARKNWDYVRSERQRMSAELSQMGWLVLPSHANFILVSVPNGRGEEAYLGLKKQGILVRYFNQPGLTDKIRITIGQNHQNNALLAGIKTLTSADEPRSRAEPNGERAVSPRRSADSEPTPSAAANRLAALTDKRESVR